MPIVLVGIIKEAHSGASQHLPLPHQHPLFETQSEKLELTQLMAVGAVDIDKQENGVEEDYHYVVGEELLRIARNIYSDKN